MCQHQIHRRASKLAGYWWVKPWRTFPSFRQVLASSSCSSSPTPGPAGPISDGNGCRSRILSAHSRLTRNQLGLMNAPGCPAMTKMHQSLPAHLTVLFTLPSPPPPPPPPPHPIWFNYLRIALIALVQPLMLKLKMKRVLPGSDVALGNLCSLLAACVWSSLNFSFLVILQM